MKKVKEPAPHEKAAQIEKEAVRALSVDEAEEALTKSTYGGVREEDAFTPEQTRKMVMRVQEENEKLRKELDEVERCYKGTRIEVMERNKDIDVLKAECLDLNEEKKQLERHVELADAEIEKLKMEKKKLQRELDDMKKTISKMKYAHEEEIRALEDDLAESKILNKKAGEYSSMLDADSDAFETILEMAKVIHGLAKSTESISLLIKDEVEGHV